LESEALSDQALVTTYKDQGGVERGFRFLKDPLFLASWVTVSKPERIIALSLIMVLCLTSLSFSRISAAGTPGRDRADHSRPGTQTDSTSDDAALVFQCFEGIELLHVQTSTASFSVVLRLEALHRLILALLGPLYEKIYNPSG
jgi:transposase